MGDYFINIDLKFRINYKYACIVTDQEKIGNLIIFLSICSQNPCYTLNTNITYLYDKSVLIFGNFIVIF